MEDTATVLRTGDAADTAPVSTPWSAPAFGPPPHRWSGVRTILFPYVVDADAAAAIMPPGVELIDGAGSVALLSYPGTDFMHPFNECVVLVPARAAGVEGNYVPYIFVTTDEALIPGREIAGWPKRIADIGWERSGDHVSVSVARFGETILELEGDVSGTMPAELVAGGTETMNPPSFNYKLVPGPDGRSIEVEEITATQLQVTPSRVELGSGKLCARSTTWDPGVAALVGESEGMLVVLESDNVIPAGEVLVRIERGAGT